MALMLLELDKFKPINDTFGHQVGDLLLKEVAQRLLGCLRETDTVSRLGGDEFVVLLPKVKAGPDAVLVAEKILRALNQTFVLAEYKLNISAIIGVSYIRNTGIANSD
jgi:diguanylate cyclase (GGDEF)-like protein